jgi:predicted component of type VI protein secretion system
VDHDQVRETLEAQISALVRTRRESQDANEKSAASEAIARLENEVNQLDITAADALPAKVNEIIAALDAVLNEHDLDAVSALGRSIRRIRDMTGQG